MRGSPRAEQRRFEQTRSARRGGFSPRQQNIYRSLVERAWNAASAGKLGRDYLAKDRWYREILHEKLGVYTSKALNKTGDFEKACAAFEEIWGGDIYWQLRVTAAPLERARLQLKKIVDDYNIAESYIEGTARQMFKTHPSNLNAGQLNDVIVALKKHFNEPSELHEATTS